MFGALRQTKTVQRAATITVAESDLSLVVVTRSRDNEGGHVHWRKVTWQHQGERLDSTRGIDALTEGFGQLVADENLGNTPISIALSSKLCVTRNVNGTAEEVQRELKALEARSQLYISLGMGNKLSAESITQVDARHQQAWFSVANERVVEAVYRAAKAAGIRVQRIEHGLIGMCRAVGATNADRKGPVIIIEVDGNGVDLALSYQGELLLDYRPGGKGAKEQIGEYVLRHLKRLRRYCRRYAAGELSRVYLCGNPDDVDDLRRQFDGQHDLVARVLAPAANNHDWTYDDNISFTPSITASLGSAVFDLVHSEQHQSPNLLTPLLDGQREPLWPLVFRTLLPTAATVLIAIGLTFATWYEKSKCRGIEQTLSDYSATRLQVAKVRYDMTMTGDKLDHLHAIRRQIFESDWAELVNTIAENLPNGVWLDMMRADDRGHIHAAGASFSDDGVYNFLAALKQIPELQNVALESTQAALLQGGPATRFELKWTIKSIAELHDGGEDL